MGRIFKVDPSSQQNQHVLTCFVVYLRLFWVPFGIVCGLPCGEPGAGAYLEKAGFRFEGVSIFTFWAFARATNNTEHEMKHMTESSENAQRHARAERSRKQIQKSSIWEP